MHLTHSQPLLKPIRAISIISHFFKFIFPSPPPPPAADSHSAHSALATAAIFEFGSVAVALSMIAVEVEPTTQFVGVEWTSRFGFLAAVVHAAFEGASAFHPAFVSVQVAVFVFAIVGVHELMELAMEHLGLSFE
jgi:hypothetical protein